MSATAPQGVPATSVAIRSTRSTFSQLSEGLLSGFERPSEGARFFERNRSWKSTGPIAQLARARA